MITITVNEDTGEESVTGPCGLVSLHEAHRVDSSDSQSAVDLSSAFFHD